MEFNKNAKELIAAKDSIQTIEERIATENRYAFLSEGSEGINDLFLTEVKKQSKARPDELTKSRNLMLLAELATTAWKGTQYADAKKWKALSKHFQRAFDRSTSKFNYTKDLSFRIKLVDNEGRKFYYDKKPGLSELNLYQGKKPTGGSKTDDADEEELPDPVPLEYFTEEELVKQFTRELKRSSVMADLNRGRYACIGLHVEIDQTTLNKNRIPTARVVLILGARRLRDIQL